MKKKFIVLLFAFVFVLIPSISLAQMCGDGFCDIQNNENPLNCSIDCGSGGGSGGGGGGGTGSGNTNTVCNTPIRNAGDVICKLNEILGAIIPFLVALGVVYFVWGVVQYVISSEEEAKKKGRARMIYGIIGLVVIVGLWGLVAIVTNTFGLSNQAPNVNNMVTTAQSSNSSACAVGNSPKLGNLLDFVTCFIGRSVVPLLFALAIVMFVWGVIQYVIGANEEKERARGKQFMIWGIVALAVMVSVWGIVKITTNTFGIQFGVPQLK